MSPAPLLESRRAITRCYAVAGFFFTLRRIALLSSERATATAIMPRRRRDASVVADYCRARDVDVPRMTRLACRLICCRVSLPAAALPRQRRVTCLLMSRALRRYFYASAHMRDALPQPRCRHAAR